MMSTGGEEGVEAPKVCTIIPMLNSLQHLRIKQVIEYEFLLLACEVLAATAA